MSGRWSAAPWIAIFTGNGESLGADLTVLWQGIGTSLALSAVTVVIMLVLLVPTMVIVHIRFQGFGARDRNGWPRCR